jgi:enediyne biosynthesis protein E4
MPHRWNRRTRLLVYWGTAAALAVVVSQALVFTTWQAGYEAWDPEAALVGVTDVLSGQAPPEAATFRFSDVTTDAGIDFVHFPATRSNVLPEDMGSGLAWGDFDDDGLPDLFLANIEGPFSGEGGDGRCALFRNRGDGTFADVTAESGIRCGGIGMAAAWGDYNNSGWLDLYITRHGPNLLFRNNGDGTFTDVSEEAGVTGGPSFSAGAAWGDFTLNGHLDLYVTNFVDFSYEPGEEEQTGFQHGAEVPFTLNPLAYPPQPNYLFRNNGDGTFTEVAAEAGVTNPDGRSLEVVWADFNNNGLPDLYVANDISDNALFVNRGNGTFEDASARALVADYRSGMGLAVTDLEGNGLLDIFITNWVAQRNSFFRNVSLTADASSDRAPLLFLEGADRIGLGAPSLPMVGWSTGFVDLDNSGSPDLWVVNGHTFPQVDDRARLRPQPVQFFRGMPGQPFMEVTAHVQEGRMASLVGRGGAHADFDRDGRVDLAISVHGDRPVLLRNVTPDPGHWLTLRLRQEGWNTRALGARVAIRVGDHVQTAAMGASSSYLSQSPAEVHFGLGEAEVIDELVVHWPDGAIQVEREVTANQLLTLHHVPTYPAAPRPPWMGTLPARANDVPDD